ncbi:kinetochore protein CHL4 like-domain-containing protein [Leucosporidium creatinivorum]|uniref:Kinetochore protein CHL4 like-domain-containing protein n=1 Tax=Leucosporidium creatinivorum TaxID=106004 RepID=A0A1Y2ER80_9BASI|nr:kinetochore protein CHL4 like-domain-containing protein [Leucosporidium creatinivorum]
MSRPAKRATLDNNLHPQQSTAPDKLLARLTKPSLCALALQWLTEQHPNSIPRGRGDDDSEESDDEEEEDGQRNLNKLYQDMRDDPAVTKAKLVAKIGRDWRQGFTYRQIAQLDVQYLLDKPTNKSWTAYQLIHDGPSPMYATPAQLLTRLRTALSPYFNHLLILLAPARECKELDLKGKNWEGVRAMLLERQAAGGQMGRWRKGKGEGGGPLVPEGRRVVRDDSKPTPKPDEPQVELEEGSLQAAREKEVGEVWGREELPVLERLDYEIALPYPSTTTTPQLTDQPPFLLRLEGTHVLAGLRAAVAAGFADGGGEGGSGFEKEGGLPEWIGGAMGLGRNLVRVGGGGGGEEGR